MTIQVKTAVTEAEKEAIYRLRYEIYIEELGDHEKTDDGSLFDEMDSQARLLMALDGEELVGTLRINWPGDGPFPPKFYKYYDLDRFLPVVSEEQIIVFDRFAVMPAYRGTQVPFQLLAAISLFSLERHIQLAFCDCKPHLLNLYIKLGFRTYTSSYDSGGVGILVPLVFVCQDIAYLRQVGSPLLAFEQGYTFNTDIPEKIAPLLVQDKPALESATDEIISEWVQAYDLLSRTGTTKISLFQDINEEDIAKILASSHLIECKKGDHIIVAGRNYRSVFVILAGRVEIRDKEKVTGVRTDGDVVGEIGFLLKGRRIADVVAATDNVRVLSLREKTIRQLKEKEPALAAQLMHNLARIVALKLISLYQRVADA